MTENPHLTPMTKLEKNLHQQIQVCKRKFEMKVTSVIQNHTKQK